MNLQLINFSNNFNESFVIIMNLLYIILNALINSSKTYFLSNTELFELSNKKLI